MALCRNYINLSKFASLCNYEKDTSLKKSQNKIIYFYKFSLFELKKYMNY